MKLVIDGEDGDFNNGTTASRLLVEKEVTMPQIASAELSGRTTKRTDFG